LFTVTITKSPGDLIGLFISDAQTGGPAEKGGILSGEILVSFNDQAL
jgi:S1-C subfamily serine protease